MKAPVVGSPPVVGHSIQFNYDALALIQRLQESKGDVFQLNILNEDVLLFLTPSATKQIFLDPDDNFSSKHGWEFSIGPTFENGCSSAGSFGIRIRLFIRARLGGQLEAGHPVAQGVPADSQFFSSSAEVPVVAGQFGTDHGALKRPKRLLE